MVAELLCAVLCLLNCCVLYYNRLAQENKHREHGFPDEAYGFSKIGMTVMSILQQKALDAQGLEDVVVNGVSTDSMI